jgi:F-type H+-transporting ATPase subunit delta
VSVQAQPHEYAKAIYDLALEAWTRQLVGVQQVLKTDAAISSAISDAGTDVGDRLKLLDAKVAGGLSDGVRRFLGTLLEAGQVDQLDAILVEFERLSRPRPERQLARVTSAVPLTGAEEEALRAKLSRRFGQELEFQFEVDPTLIGGIYLRVGDQVIDGTIAGKLAALRDRLAA